MNNQLLLECLPTELLILSILLFKKKTFSPDNAYSEKLLLKYPSASFGISY